MAALTKEAPAAISGRRRPLLPPRCPLRPQRGTGHFDALRSDYEVEWHLGRIRDGRRAPTLEEARVQSARVKNRRRAYLNQLIRGGEYFSEEAMREREPYLHHEYLGRSQDPNDRCMARPGERWSETLTRRRLWLPRSEGRRSVWEWLRRKKMTKKKKKNKTRRPR